MREREPEIAELLCAPEATDDLEDIEFEDADEESERDFIEAWIREERAYQAAKMEERHVEG